MPLTRFLAGGDKLIVQVAQPVQNYDGITMNWVTTATNIHACVAALYDNVNHAWGESRSHDIYRVMINERTAQLLNLNYAATQFLWNNFGNVITLRPIEDEIPYGKRPRKLTVIRCEDITDVELPPPT